MEKAKIALIYYSSTGNNTKMMLWAKDTLEKNGAEVRLLKVNELVPKEIIDNNPKWKENTENTKDILVANREDLKWADGIIFSSPTRYGVMCGQMKQFFDSNGGAWAQGYLAGKPVTAMSTAQNPHGGQEMTVRSIYTVLQHWGAIIVPPGFIKESYANAGGNPYGISATVDRDNNMKDEDLVKLAVEDMAEYFLNVVNKLK